MNNYLNWTIRKYVQNDLKRMGFPSKFISEYISDLDSRSWGRPFRYITEVLVTVLNPQLSKYGLVCVCDNSLIIKKIEDEN